MNVSVLIFILVCIVCGTHATFDLSNLDLVNFNYFKYPETTTVKPFYFKHHGHLFSIRKITKPPTKLEDTINRTKAAAKYLKNLAFGNPDEKIRSSLILDPDFGKKWAETYQSKHGKFGEKLVDQLGSGASLNFAQ